MEEIYLTAVEFGNKGENPVGSNISAKVSVSKQKGTFLISADFCNNYRQEGVMTEERIPMYPEWTNEREDSCVSLPQILLGIPYALISSCIRDAKYLYLLLQFSITASQNAIEYSFSHE